MAKAKIGIKTHQNAISVHVATQNHSAEIANFSLSKYMNQFSLRLNHIKYGCYDLPLSCVKNT